MNSRIKNTLVFESCGMDFKSELSDVGNHRIRSTFMNDKGRIIYLEISGHENTGNLRNSLQHLKFPFHITHCFDLTFQKSNHDPRLSKVEHVYGEYKKENLIKIINDRLDCSFTDIELSNEISGFEMKAIFKANYKGCFKEYAGKEVTLCEFIPCDELDSDYWVKVKEIEEAHLIKTKNFIGFN